MTKTRRITVPNARLLYFISRELCRDWQKILWRLDKFLEKSPLQKANPFIYLYYFLPTNDVNFISSKSWVCREIIGNLKLDHNADFHFYDLSKAQAWSTLWNHGLERLSFKELWQWENETRKSLTSSLADTWCLQIGVEEDLFLSIEMRHFPK
ncbi:MAG: hypothetical protein OXB84_03000 [Halobacteriovoraceae bacterium]|nr:hypothetical protein [Halobacteriovoraceae bacterium]